MLLLLFQFCTKVFLLLLELGKHILVLLLIAGKVLLLTLTGLQSLLLVLAVLLQSGILNVYLGLCTLDACHLLLSIMRYFLHIENTPEHLLKTFCRKDKEQGRLLHLCIVTLAHHTGIVGFVGFEVGLQRITRSAQAAHLPVEGVYLIAERVYQLLLCTDVLAEQLQLVERRGLVFLGLLQHFVGLLYLLLQVLLFLLQAFDRLGRYADRRTE